MWHRTGLRARLFSGILAVLLAAVAGLAVAVYRFTESMEVALIENQLEDRIAEFAAAYAADPATAPPRSRDLRGYVVRGGAGAPGWLGQLGPGMHEDVAGDGQTYYVVRRDVGATRLYLALDIAPLERLETRMLAAGILSGIVAVALAGVAAWGIARIVLEPVSQLARRVSELDPVSRGTRVGIVSADREVQLIITAFDRYLERLDAFVTREQAFTVDVSHELRTPLATVLSAAQLLLTDPDLPVVVRGRIERIQRAAEGMREVTEAMLLLAREPVQPGGEVCVLDQVLREVIENYRELARSRGLDLRLSIDAADTVAAPSGMVTSIIGNVVGNAVDHAQGGVVDVELQRGVLTVRNEGPPIPGGELTRLFERGYRSSTSHGHGLGLALVKRICDHLGWAVAIESGAGRGTCVQVQFAPVA